MPSHINNQTWLKTTRLHLRPFAREDLEVLHALWCDPHVRQFLWDDIIIPQDAAREVIAASRHSFEQQGFGFWNILRKDAEQHAGFCGLRFIDEAPDVEILYGLWPKFWGQGFATEAAQAVLRFGFEACNLECLFAGTDPPNAASIRVMERLAMKFDRQIRRNNLDVVYYSLSRKEWLTSLSLPIKQPSPFAQLPTNAAPSN